MTAVHRAHETREPRMIGDGTDDGPPCPLTVDSGMEIPQAWCAHCRAEKVKTRNRIRKTSPRGTGVVHRFYAPHPGTCSRCGGDYAVDDLIGVTLAEKYVCEECA